MGYGKGGVYLRVASIFRSLNSFGSSSVTENIDLTVSVGLLSKPNPFGGSALQSNIAAIVSIRVRPLPHAVYRMEDRPVDLVAIGVREVILDHHLHDWRDLGNL